MNNSVLKAFAKNGLEILQWSILLLLYETKGHTLTQKKISECLNLSTFAPNSERAEGATDYVLVREILKSVQTKGKYVDWLGQGEWELTPEGINFVKNGLDP